QTRVAGAPVADRQRAARAPVARPQTRQGQVRVRPRQHAPPPPPLVAAALPRVRRRARGDRRDAPPASVDDGPGPGSRVSRLASSRSWLRAHAAVLAIASVGFGWAFVIHTMGWAQLAHFAEVR